ncbi:bromodomain associated family expressed [Chrysochromulina tobinii]|uniref:Transcription initiation factor TFIID subunit 8 n=1 Tax=Chrysochromulina tobinii TaxID=1460289 RepID=A0A0M0JBY0_9EUKA|nr:bromodomain associated family expressed [Chrysochromulina tobinii]|eukprot:KOO24091.1 bromodomain associated family expressed [Chrysochromulina sp. CCMP291]
MLSYPAAAARTALALIVSEARVGRTVGGEGGGVVRAPGGYEAIERSASEALLDIFTRYMRSIGTASRLAAEHAGRAESNLADMLVGLDSVRAAPPHELLAFLNEEASEVAFPGNFAAFPHEEVRPVYVPDFLPPFPEKRTYVRTAMHAVRENDAPAAKKRRSKHKRQAQDSLLALTEAMACRTDGDDGTASLSGPAPPPLPALPADDDEGANGDAATAGDEVAAVLRGVPDGLATGIPAVLQSSAKLECSGLQSPTVQPAAVAGGEPIGAAAAVTANPRQAAILGLKHLHGLDGIDEGRSGGHDD